MYTLNEVEQQLARIEALARWKANRKAGTENKKVGPQSDAETDLEGVGAELAYCHLFNVYPDLSIGTRKGGHDAIWAGRRIDVKSTQYPNGRLLAVAFKQGDAVDLYALMIGTFPTYRFAGMATSSQLIVAERLEDLGHGPSYAMKQSEIAPARRLVEENLFDALADESVNYCKPWPGWTAEE